MLDTAALLDPASKVNATTLVLDTLVTSWPSSQDGIAQATVGTAVDVHDGGGGDVVDGGGGDVVDARGAGTVVDGPDVVVDGGVTDVVPDEAVVDGADGELEPAVETGSGVGVGGPWPVHPDPATSRATRATTSRTEVLMSPVWSGHRAYEGQLASRLRRRSTAPDGSRFGLYEGTTAIE